ncbi:MAG: hypothetical protein Q9160_000137 [Pyrenula sp. 1 TL-2023]
MSEGLSKVDSGVGGVSQSPPKDDKAAKRRTSSTVTGVYNIADLGKPVFEQDQHYRCLGRALNTSPTSVEEKEVLKKFLTTPPVKKIDLHFPLGLEVTARNLKGVTIKDALDAIHKQFKKKQDDELDMPYLAGFEWDKEESWTRLIVHQKKEGGAPAGKKKKNKDDA